MINPLPNHGTKVLGVCMTIAGAVSVADPNTMGKYGPAIVMIAGGILTALRGFQNSSNQPDVLPPPVQK